MRDRGKTRGLARGRETKGRGDRRVGQNAPEAAEEKRIVGTKPATKLTLPASERTALRLTTPGVPSK
eukprot:4613523-Lingulodinium_polyedra.AAC.1